MTKRSIAMVSAVAVAAFMGTTAFAGTSSGKSSKAVKEVVKESCISGDLGVDFTSNYISRGVPQENQGVIAQPYTNLYFKLYEGSGALTKISANLSTWYSIHSHKSPFAGSTTSAWYEFDYAGGLTFEFGKFSITPSFLSLLSPNDSFADNYNLNIALAYDDSDLLGAFSLKPRVTVMFELEGKAGSGTEEGIYYEVAISPGFKAGNASITFPITLGLGSNGFYGDPFGAGGDDTFGFFSAGVAMEYPLAFVPECLGNWALKANATYYHLGSNAAAQGLANAATDGDDNQWAFGGGLIVRF
jgi:hypothetical protein